MDIHPPLVITPRLMAGIRVADGWVAVEPIGRAEYGRVVWRYVIDAPGIEHEGTDLSGASHDPARAVSDLLAFLEHSADADDGEEGSDLFPANVRQWARDNADEIGMARFENEG